MSELKACPFCGKAPLVRSLGAEMIICPNGCVFMATDDRLERWNTRPIEDALKAENAKLREALGELIRVGKDVEQEAISQDAFEDVMGANLLDEFDIVIEKAEGALRWRPLPQPPEEIK